MAMPDRTSSQCHRASSMRGPCGNALPTGAHQSARGSPAPGCRKIRFSPPISVFVQGVRSSLAIDSIAAPVMPQSRKSALASLRLALARITNIDRRLSVAARMSRLQTSRTSSWLRLNSTKLACIRPLALQKAARRACDRPSEATSCVSWPCKNVTASAPATRITPRCGNSQMPEAGEALERSRAGLAGMAGVMGRFTVVVRMG